MIRESVAREKAAVLKLAQIIVQRQSGLLTDAEALTAPEGFEIWSPDMRYGADQVIQHEETLYRVVQEVASSQEHQQPGGEGMLAVYRPIVPTASGTEDDPIPWIYGMDCSAGLYYSYNEQLYLCKGDMLPCVWPPDSGIWQWEVKS